MYGLSVLTWGSGPDVKKYSTAIKRELFSGEAGHAALWLTIPDTTLYRCIQAGVTSKLKAKFNESGTEMKSRMLFATPQGVMLYASKLQSDLFRIYANSRARVSAGDKKSFSYVVQMIVSNLINKIFMPNKYTRLVNQRKELSFLIEQTLNGVEVLERDFAGAQNKGKSYETLKNGAAKLVEGYLKELDDVKDEIAKIESKRSKTKGISWALGKRKALDSGGP